MSMEFLMPQKYEGRNCGLTVTVCGLREDVVYDNITIYIENNKENAHEVTVDKNDSFKTTCATFDDLKDDRFYNVVAEINYGSISNQINAKMVASIISDKQPIMLMSLDMSDQPVKKKYGGTSFNSSPQGRVKIIEG